MKNPYVRRLIHGRRVHIAQVAPWSDRRTPRGRVVVVAFARASTVHGRWIALHGRPYQAAYAGVSGLRIYVNLATGQVVGVLPWAAKG